VANMGPDQSYAEPMDLLKEEFEAFVCGDP
jgi:hypothetical protein